MMGRFRAAIDGGSRGNPGLAAWGLVLLDDNGAPIEGHAGVIGEATNNVAEYSGLLEALRMAGRAGAREVEILTDSELIARQIEGKYRVKNPGLKPLFAEAMKLIAGFDSFSIRHVRREENTEADRMVNRALNLAAGGAADVRLRESYASEPAGG
jgi:ribonuclease HI